ncbi:MAG: hypothetical protein RL385_5637 [Pseudomonadota bacterium]|jgi:phospholipid/cholesterol/gamma-HCH transport system substrate-binding protein
MSPRRQGDILRAGVFLAVGLLFFTAAIFLLGQKSALFTRTTTLYVNLEDTSGIAVGAPVRLAGMEVGTVGALTFPTELDRKETQVRLVVQSKYMHRIRGDSKVFIDSAGLLGDKFVNISLGSKDTPQLRDGATLPPGRSVNFDELAENLDRAVKSVAGITHSLETIVHDERTARVQDDVSRITSSIANILGEVESGQGLLHRLLYDPKYADQAGAILQEARGLAATARQAISRVERVLGEVESGEGTLHEVIYGASGKEALRELTSAAREIDAVVHEVRDGKGVLHKLVYDEGQTRFLEDLNAMSAALNRVAQDVDKGRGTLGGLAKDPTVYEDLKTVLGNVKRNVVFKALIRYTQEKDHLRRAEDAPRAKE